MIRFTRRQLARYAADQLLAGNDHVLRAVSEHLRSTSRAKQTELMARDIQHALLERGEVNADVVSAHPLDEQSRESIRALLAEHTDSQHISLDETVDASLLGGIQIRTADETLDASLLRKVNQLKTMNI